MNETTDSLCKRIDEWETALPADAGLTETLLVVEVQAAVRAALDRARVIMDHVEQMEAIGMVTDSDMARLVGAQTEVRRLMGVLHYLLRDNEDRSDLDQLVEASNLLN